MIDVITREQIKDAIKNYMSQLQDEDKIIKCQWILAKIDGLSEKEFQQKLYHTLGEKPDLTQFKKWLLETLEELEWQNTKFIPLNAFVSYHIEEKESHDTFVLHVIPKHVTKEQLRNSGTYLVDALEKIRAKMQEGEFEKVNAIFAVSDILRLPALQEPFKALGFDVKQGDDRFKKQFRKPYQVFLPKHVFLSEAWEQRKEEFMRGRLTISELKKEEELEK